jgi:F-type H+-transporting ATPase subunit gamma
LATLREIRKRIQSVSSTKKITKTMEMISTSKMKKMQTQLYKSKPFENKLENVICTLLDEGMTDLDETLIMSPEDASDKLILMVTGNHGLCGSYNTNVIENTVNLINQFKEQDDKYPLIHVLGQKGINYCNLLNIPISESESNPEDKITFDYASKLGSYLIEVFERGKISNIFISYTKVISPVISKPAVYQLLPISCELILEEVQRTKEERVYIFEPDYKRILSSLWPLYVNIKLYIILLESGFCEQSSRRIAMKNATDAATKMIKDLSIKYNRARQAKITNEIAEIVGAAAALE